MSLNYKVKNEHANEISVSLDDNRTRSLQLKKDHEQEMDGLEQNINASLLK